MIRILVIHSIKVNFSLNKNALFQNKKFKCIYVNFYGALNLAINYDLVGWWVFGWINTMISMPKKD